MKKSFLLFLTAILAAAFMGGCGGGSVSQKVNFSEAEKLSFKTPDEKEIFLDKDDKKTVLDILSNAEPSGKSEQSDGGMCFTAYKGDEVQWNITIYDASHICAGTSGEAMYKISESDYTTICDLYEELQE